MPDQDVGLLDAGRDRVRLDDATATLGSERTPVAAEQADRQQADLVAALDGAQHVPRVARGRDPNQAVARRAQRSKLAAKYLVEGVVVADAGQRRAVSA